ncbi:MAG: single-stranded DNA-binding protein [Campylobacterota bacterium]
MYNKVVLVGNLTRDIELRYSQGGLGIAKVGIATNRKYKSQQGEQKEEVCFVDLSMFGRTAEIANQYLRKGSKVLVEGRLVLEQWTDQSGQKRSKHSVTVENLQMLDSKGDAQGGGYSQPAPQNGYANSAQNSNPHSAPQNSQAENIPEIDIDNEEVPF